jgi:hypothetical protein
VQDVMTPRDRSPLGFLLVAPAALLTILTLVVPSVQTVWHSMKRMGFIGGGSFVGLRNYSRVLGEHVFWRALGYSLALGLIPLVVAVVVAPLLAAALDRSGSAARRAGSVLMSVPLVVFSPVAAAAAWVVAKQHKHLGSSLYPEPTGRGWPVALMSSAAVFGAVCGLGLLVFLAVMRGRRTQSPTAHRNALAAVVLLVILTTFAISLQEFSFSQSTGDTRSESLNGLQFRQSFEILDLGDGSVVATILGVLLGVLGIAAVLVLLIARLRIDVAPADRGTEPWPWPWPGPATITTTTKSKSSTPLLGIAALVVLAIVTIVTMLPWLTTVFHSAHVTGSTFSINMNTWVPSIAGAVISVGVAFVAALGIGGLRPLGRRSEWLLLPFAPWLFVGIGPLAEADYLNLHSLHWLNTLVALVPPILVSVPALVVLTLFCSSRSAIWRNDPRASFAHVVVAPALPLAVFLVGATTIVNAQRLFWPEIVAQNPNRRTAPVALLQQMEQFTGGGPIGLTTPLLVVIVVLAALVALQLLYFDRTVIVSGPVRGSSAGRSR